MPSPFRSWLLTVAYFPGVVLVGMVLGIIQIRYPRAVENDALLAPIAVTAVAGDTLTLADGRTLRLEETEKPLEQMIRESGGRVDVELPAGDSQPLLYVSRRGWICGTPWVGVVNLPLIPDDIPINRRHPLGFATLVERED